MILSIDNYTLYTSGTCIDNVNITYSLYCTDHKYDRLQYMCIMAVVMYCSMPFNCTVMVEYIIHRIR